MEIYEGRPASGAGRMEKEMRCYDLLDGLGIRMSVWTRGGDDDRGVPGGR